MPALEASGRPDPSRASWMPADGLPIFRKTLPVALSTVVEE
jgi:hypothetical protein